MFGEITILNFVFGRGGGLVGNTYKVKSAARESKRERATKNSATEPQPKKKRAKKGVNVEKAEGGEKKEDDGEEKKVDDGEEKKVDDGEEKVVDPKGKTKVVAPKRKAAAKAKMEPEKKHSLWEATLPELQEAKIEVPEGFGGERSSWTITQDNAKSIGVLWDLNQLYVNKVLKPEVCMQAGISVNRRGGATVSIRKRGGWGVSFQLAKSMAGWHNMQG